MNKTILLQPAYVLHTRPYRDTSLLVDCLTKDFGKIRLVAKGARQKHSKKKPLLQAFTPIEISWLGKTDLLTLTAVEALGMPFLLTGKILFAGLYMNELLVKCLLNFDTNHAIFTLYENTLQHFLTLNSTDFEIILRQFESTLLAELGYALPITHDLQTGEAVQSEEYYLFQPDIGIKRVPAATAPAPRIFKGASLIAIKQNSFSDIGIIRDAKRLMRLAIQHLLDGKTIKSRDLFL